MLALEYKLPIYLIGKDIDSVLPGDIDQHPDFVSGKQSPCGIIGAADHDAAGFGVDGLFYDLPGGQMKSSFRPGFNRDEINAGLGGEAAEKGTDPACTGA